GWRPGHFADHFAALVPALSFGDAAQDFRLRCALARQAAADAELAGHGFQPLAVELAFDSADLGLDRFVTPRRVRGAVEETLQHCRRFFDGLDVVLLFQWRFRRARPRRGRLARLLRGLHGKNPGAL